MIAPFSLQALRRFVPQSLPGAAILAATPNLASAQLCGCNGNIQTYCTAGTSVQGCVPSISGTGVPNVLAPSGFDLVVSSVPGQRYGTIFYGFYSFITPWAPGSPSFKCVASPVQRMGNISTGGTIGQCNGELRLDFNAWIAANPAALGGPFAQGQTIRAQGWYRDPAAPGQTNLSNALSVTLCGNNAGACASIPGFVLISPGVFQMGEDIVATPIHPVSISYHFWMKSKEVTQAEYLALMGGNPSSFQGDLNRPVEQVSWFDARNYCAALTAQQAALGAVPSGYEYRLPTEAEWEYGCRAGTTTKWNTGNSLVCVHANHEGSMNYCVGQTIAVGGYLPNPWGLYDMHGNVWEWCLDSYGGYPSNAVTDPFVTGGPYRIFRGGSWYDNSYACRSAYRGYNSPGTALEMIGIRVVLAPIIVP